MSEFVAGNRFLTREEMEINAVYIRDYLLPRGWTLNAIAGMLGNMQTESTINPAIWQNCTENPSNGYGLVQWTPSTKYTNWCTARGLDPASMDSALQRIEYEMENGLQFYSTRAFPITFKQFKVSQQSPYYLGMAFLRNYERPANQNQPKRGTQAEEWFTFLSGQPAPTPSVDELTPTKKRGLSLLLMYSAIKGR